MISVDVLGQKGLDKDALKCVKKTLVWPWPQKPCMEEKSTGAMAHANVTAVPKHMLPGLFNLKPHQYLLELVANVHKRKSSLGVPVLFNDS